MTQKKNKPFLSTACFFLILLAGISGWGVRGEAEDRRESEPPSYKWVMQQRLKENSAERAQLLKILAATKKTPPTHS